MGINTELFLIHLALIDNSLRVLVNSTPARGTKHFPSVVLRNDLFIYDATREVLRGCFQDLPLRTMELWLNSPRYRDRIIESFDRELLFEQRQSLAIVRAIAIPQELSLKAKGEWFEIKDLLSDNSSDKRLTPDCRIFLQECLDLIPYWTRFTPFVFELLPEVFPIFELRNFVNIISQGEIDAGNFHRRLKKLDILKPLLGKSHQRVHKWEFDWEKRKVLSEQGLIP